MAIDLHAHWIPPPLAASLRARRIAPWIERLGDGTERLHMPIGTLALDARYFDLDRRIAMMDDWGVRRQLLSLPGLFGVDSLPAHEAAPLTRGFNDALVAACRAQPERFAGLAALPIADIEASVAELRRTRTLGLAGAILPIDAFASLAHAERMRPVLAAADALGAHLFLHPGKRPDDRADLARTAPGAVAAEAVDVVLARRALEVQHEVAGAMVTLLLTDLLDAYPRLGVQVANLGGTFPAVVERMDHTVLTRTPDAPLPSSRARRVHVDCASLGPRALEQAVALYGADRVVIGTDCPIFRTDWTLEAVRQARLAGDERELILVDNAQRLLDRVGA